MLRRAVLTALTAMFVVSCAAEPEPVEPQATEPQVAEPQSSEQSAWDIDRFSPTPSDRFETFHVTDTSPLREALRAGSLQEDTPVMLVETAAGPLALLPDQMAYHHIAQGRAGNKDWMATF